MICHHHQTPIFRQHLRHLRQHLFQHIHLSIHLNTQRLKHLCQILLLSFVLKEWFHNLHKSSYIIKFHLPSRLHYSLSQFSRLLQLPIEIKHIRQFLFTIFIQHIRRRFTRRRIHSHIQFTLKTKRKPSCFIIQMVRTHTQIRQYPIHLLNSIIFQKVLQISKITSHKRKSLIIKSILHRIQILVKRIQMTTFPQSLQYSTRMTTPTKSQININPIRLNIQTIQTLRQHNRNMIFTIHNL